MRCTSYLAVLLCIFKCIGLLLAICTTSSYEGGFGNRLHCSNATLQTISNQTANVTALMVSNSDLRYIPERAFARYEGYLQSLNIHNCHINDIHPDAFAGLARLKKLSLPNNNLTSVKEKWFKDLVYLEQLDLSFNHIDVIQPTVFSWIPLLKRLDIRDNRLTCFMPAVLPGGIDKLYFFGNPLNLKCRGQLTLWLRDHGVSYKTQPNEKEAWLDKLLWLCAMGDETVAKSEDLMKECVILNLFNQLRTGLSTAESYPLTTNCSTEKDLLLKCVVDETRRSQSPTNGNVIKKLLLYVQQTKSSH